MAGHGLGHVHLHHVMMATGSHVVGFPDETSTITIQVQQSGYVTSTPAGDQLMLGPVSLPTQPIAIAWMAW
jgi:hypothetical protein